MTIERIVIEASPKRADGMTGVLITVFTERGGTRIFDPRCESPSAVDGRRFDFYKFMLEAE